MSGARDEQRRIVEESIANLAAAARTDAVERKSVNLREQFVEFSRLQDVYVVQEALEDDAAELLIKTTLAGKVSSELEAAEQKISDWKLLKTIKLETKSGLNIKKTIETKITAIQNLLAKTSLNLEEWDFAKDSIDLVKTAVEDFQQSQATVLSLKGEMGETDDQLNTFEKDGDDWVDNIRPRLEDFSVGLRKFPHSTGGGQQEQPAADVLAGLTDAIRALGHPGGGAAAAGTTPVKSSFPKVKIQEMRKFSGQACDFPLWKHE